MSNTISNKRRKKTVIKSRLIVWRSVYVDHCLSICSLTPKTARRNCTKMPVRKYRRRTSEISCCLKYIIFSVNVLFWVSLKIKKYHRNYLFNRINWVKEEKMKVNSFEKYHCVSVKCIKQKRGRIVFFCTLQEIEIHAISA